MRGIGKGCSWMGDDGPGTWAVERGYCGDDDGAVVCRVDWDEGYWMEGGKDSMCRSIDLPYTISPLCFGHISALSTAPLLRCSL